MDDVELKRLCYPDIASLFAFEQKNQSYFERYVPPRPEGYLTLKGMGQAVANLENEMAHGKGAYFLLWQKGKLVGRINFSRCMAPKSDEGRRYELGYRIGAEQSGRGLASAGLKLALAWMKLNSDARVIEANAALNNIASVRVLEKCGFEPCGIVKEVRILNGSKVDLLSFILTVRTC